MEGAEVEVLDITGGFDVSDVRAWEAVGPVELACLNAGVTTGEADIDRLSDVIDRALQVHGGLGLTDQSPLSHMYTAARSAHIYDGPDEVHRMVVSRRILEAFAEGGVWEFS